MPWDRKHLLGYVETIQLILGVTDNLTYHIVEHESSGAQSMDVDKNFRLQF